MPNTSFLDVLCNGIGAMMLVLVLVASKHFVRPDLPQQGALVVEVLSRSREAKLGLWIKGPKSAELFVDQEIAKLGAQSDPEFPGGTLMQRVSSSESDSTSTALVVFSPNAGCYEVGVFVQDYTGEIETWPASITVEARVWFRGALIRGRVSATAGDEPEGL